jgi:hypothetical protein
MDERFLTAFLSREDTQIMGYTLKPFCLRHRLVLTAMNSPLLGDAKKVQVHDLIIFLRVCQTYSIKDMLKEPSQWDAFWYAFQMRTYVKRPKLQDHVVRQLVEYLGENTSYPSVIANKEESGDDKGLNWILAVVAALVKNGWSEEEAWTMSEARAVWYSTCIAIGNGSKIEVLTTQMEQLLDKLAKEKN